MSEQRIKPVEQSEWSDDVRTLFTVMDGPDAYEKGPSRNIVYYFARSPVLAQKFLEFGKHLLWSSSLPDRERELVTLYVAWRTKSNYEWASHVAFGLRVGLNDADVEEVKKGPSSPHWSGTDKDLLLATDQIIDNYYIDESLWASLSNKWNEKEIIDLIFTIGNYMQFSAALNSLHIPLEPGDDAIIAKYGAPN